MIKIFLLMSFLLSCRNDDFVQYYDPIPRKDNQAIEGENIYALKDLGLDNGIDILFVVDNSGSMKEIQKNIILNARLFMNEFIRQRHVNWKLGVVSTDRNESPYLGFYKPYSSKTVDLSSEASTQEAVSIFQQGIAALGTNGSAFEQVFTNAVRHFENSRAKEPFLRDRSHLAVIMVSDEEEQSHIDSYELISKLRNYVSGEKLIRFYGAFDLGDLSECKAEVGEPPFSRKRPLYKGSKYEEIVELTGGFTISACEKEFGSKLAAVSKDIASLVKPPGVALRGVPKVYSIQVFYKGEELCPGSEERGGMWFYDSRANVITFNNLNFVEDFENDVLTINYEFDDGIPRDTDKPTRGENCKSNSSFL